MISLLHWLLLISPGPNLILVTQLAASGRIRSALFASLGISAVAVLWSLLAIFGVGAVFKVVPAARVALQVVGVAYLCYLALRLWRSSATVNPGEARSMGGFAAFRMGVLTNITNPKSALFFGSAFAAALPSDAPAISMALVVVVVFINAMVWHVFLAFAFSRTAVKALYQQHLRALNKMAGAVLGAIAAKLVWGMAQVLRGDAAAPYEH
jgi:threonine efflux protein